MMRSKRRMRMRIKMIMRMVRMILMIPLLLQVVVVLVMMTTIAVPVSPSMRRTYMLPCGVLGPKDIIWPSWLRGAQADKERESDL